MDKLLEISLNKVESVDTTFVRFLYQQIDWTDRLIGIRGARGVGKSTLMLQRIKLTHSSQSSLYMGLDDLFFLTTSLTSVVDHYYKLGVRSVFLDEVHKYPTWSQEIKSLYDNYPKLSIVFTGSSVVELFRRQADISRRAVFYDLPGMSFREYLELDKGIKTPVIVLEDILRNHITISRELKSTLDTPVGLLKRYLALGYYPYFKENERSYHHRLINTISLILETDLPSVENITYASVRKIKALLYVIAQSVPFKPNISLLSEKIESKRETVLQYLDFLERATLLKLLRSSKQGIVQLNKPEKIYLDNPNLIYALADGNPQIGNVRETFFMNQVSRKHTIFFPEKGDFMVDKQVIFEVGGSTKTKRQIQGIESAYIAADDLETGSGNKIPLWLFGFLY